MEGRILLWEALIGAVAVFLIVVCVWAIARAYKSTDSQEAIENSRSKDAFGQSHVASATKLWLEATPEADTDKPGLTPAYYAGSSSDPREIIVPAANQAHAEEAMPHDEGETISTPSWPNQLWHRTSPGLKVVSAFVLVWLLAILVSSGSSSAINFDYKDPRISTPSQPREVTVKPHASKKTKAKIRAKNRKLQREWRRAVRSARAKARHHAHIPLWNIIAVVGGVILLIAVIRALSQRRKK
jgi:hypothetical protein